MRKINPYHLVKNCRTSVFILLSFIGQFLFHNLQAQNSELNSINNLIANTKTDTGRINLNIKKISILRRNNLDTALYLGKLQLQEAEKLHFYPAIIRLHSQLADSYLFKGNFDSAKVHIQFIERNVKPSDSSNIANVYGSYGMMYGMQGIYDSCIKFYEKAIGINERTNNSDGLTPEYTNVSIGYQQMGNFYKALEYQQKALRLAETEKDEELTGKTILNMANTYELIGDTAKAEQTYLDAIDIAVKNNFKNLELNAYINLSALYIKSGKLDKGYNFATKAAALARDAHDVVLQASSLAKAGLALAYQNKFEKAMELVRASISLGDSSGQPLVVSEVYDAMAQTLTMQKKYREAIPYFEKSFQALDGTINYEGDFAESYTALSECYEKTGDPVKALATYKIAANIADSITRKENIRKATELSMNYDFEKKQEVLAAEKKRDEKLAETKQVALIIGLSFVIILALVAFRGYRNKQKANALLEQQKQTIENTLSDLKSTQAQLIQSEKMASLGELTAGIAHEIQNPLNFVNNFSDVNTELIDEAGQEMGRGNISEARTILNNIKENEEKINHHGKRADAIVKGMLQHSRSSIGVKEPADINALASEYLRLSFHGMKAKDKSFNATLKTNFDESIVKIDIIPQDIGRVLLNLYNNAFYAVLEKKRQVSGSYEPTVSVSTKKTNGKVEIKVVDNGNGIPQKILDKIFQPFFTTKPTGQGTGLGLSLSYDMVKAHGGEIKVNTREGEFTEFVFQLPILA